ncbi:MAG: iron ABC transporter permease [Flavobacteriales bacterium]|jgi:iron complex transport system permease protein|nr:iron ABC transporter permease [Flavobacteriales bacterium]
MERWTLPLLALAGIALFVLHLALGPVAVPWPALKDVLLGRPADPGHVTILWELRLPRAITAAAAGAGLAACALMLQTLFRNPLAGPSVLGISSGAALGVALLMLGAPLLPMLALPPQLALVAGAFAGALGVLLLMLLADRRVGDGHTLLIVGIMLGYLCSALISVLQAAGPPAALKGFVLWGMGSYAGVTNAQLAWLLVPVAVGLGMALLFAKPLNALLLGQEQAAALGTNVPRVRRTVIAVAGLLAGTITAFCGPIAFLGLATPHVVRGMVRTADHARLMPATILCGMVLSLLCDLVVRLPGQGGSVPLNAVTALLGAPVVGWVLLRGRRWSSSA